VIAAHVKDGVELGREHRLPVVVLDFIRSHHGTSTMDFFFRKAQELRGPEDPEPVEAEFRYPGPRPRTTEQAIVMLADSVEAASRSVDKPTPKRLESLVDAILSARIADGQLDKTALTFADLARIRESFHSLLCGIYHFRVKYPDQPDDAEPGEALPPAPSNRPAPENTGFVAPSAADALVEDDKEGSGLKRGFRERSSLG
jgi:membrane-associated HD superfamily phosphohydrolase